MLLRELRWRTHSSDAIVGIMSLNLCENNWEKSLELCEALGAEETRPGVWEALASMNTVT